MEKINFKLISIASLLLALDFLLHAFILILLEPGMGFKTMNDYFDTALIVPALSSVEWNISNALHMAEGILIPLIGIGIAKASNKAIFAFIDKFSVMSGVLFLVVGVTGYAGFRLINILEAGAMQDSILALATFRFIMLLTALTAFGIMICCVSWIGIQYSFLPRWFGYFGYFVALISIAFIFVPIPLVLLLWSLIFGIITFKKSKLRP